MLNVFHPDAVDLFSVCSSLEKVHVGSIANVYSCSGSDYSALKLPQVCNDLRDLSVHLNEASISYFNPFRPMLGQRAAIDQVGCQVGWEEGYWDI